jgi:hypothetical protein
VALVLLLLLPLLPVVWLVPSLLPSPGLLSLLLLLLLLP